MGEINHHIGSGEKRGDIWEALHASRCRLAAGAQGAALTYRTSGGGFLNQKLAHAPGHAGDTDANAHGVSPAISNIVSAKTSRCLDLVFVRLTLVHRTNTKSLV